MGKTQECGFITVTYLTLFDKLKNLPTLELDDGISNSNIASGSRAKMDCHLQIREADVRHASPKIE